MWTTVVTAVLVAAFTSAITGILTFLVQERKLRADLRTEFMAERALLKLLESPRWEHRTFKEIKKRVGGFQDDELRKLLVRTGAVRFEGKGEDEFWGLVSRNAGKV